VPDRPLKPSPFGASLSSGFGWFCMTTPQCTFTCVIHSRFPGQFCSPVQQFWLCFPLSTRAYQAHAEGRGCLPFTREAGVVAIPLARYHLPAWICSYEDQNDLRRSSPARTGSFERTGRRHRLQRTAAMPLLCGRGLPAKAQSIQASLASPATAAAPIRSGAN